MISIAFGKRICKCSATSSITLYATLQKKSNLINSKQKWQQTTLKKYK